MNDLIYRAALQALDDDLFKSLGFAALRARARRLEIGETLNLGGFGFLIAEDEEGEGIVVLIVLERQYIENMALDLAKELGLGLEFMEINELEWLRLFFDELERDLRRLQQIKMRVGPGENLTFEKIAYKRDLSKRA
jgi:hypothetical protein